MSHPVTPRAKWTVASLIILVSVVVDQAVKLLAAQGLKGRPGLSFLGDTFRLEYAENTGAFLSLGAQLDPGTRSLLFVLGVIVIIAVCAWWLFQARTWLAVIALASVISGGVGNLIDRVWRGSVIDFLYVGIGPVHTGVFNVADMAITGGLLVMLYDQYVVENRKKAKP